MITACGSGGTENLHVATGAQIASRRNQVCCKVPHSWRYVGEQYSVANDAHGSTDDER